MSTKVKVKQLTSGMEDFGKILISDGNENVIFTDISGLTYNIDKGTVFPGSPEGGDLFYNTTNNLLYHYDSSRTKWLTISQENLICGRTTAIAGSTIYMRVGDATQSSDSGFRLLKNGTIISASVQNSNTLTSLRNIDIRVNNSTVNRVTLTINNGQSGVIDNSLNLDFNNNDLIQVVATPGSTGSSLNNVIVIVTVSYR